MRIFSSICEEFGFLAGHWNFPRILLQRVRELAISWRTADYHKFCAAALPGDPRGYYIRQTLPRDEVIGQALLGIDRAINRELRLSGVARDRGILIARYQETVN